MVGTVLDMNTDVHTTVRCERTMEGYTVGDTAPERDKITIADTAKDEGTSKEATEGVKEDLLEDPARGRTDTRESNGSLQEWCVMSEGSINKEIFEDLQSIDMISQLAASIITRDLLKEAEEHVSTKLIDQIFRAIQEVSDVDPQIVKHFLLSHSDPEGGAEKEEDIVLLVDLFMELLQCCPLPVEHNYLWLQLLYILILDGTHLLLFVEKKVAATVLGTMAVHTSHVAVQEIGCSLLNPLALFTQVPGLKAPVRESGIQVILQAMEKHRKSERLMLKAVQVLANVACTMSAYNGWAIQQDFAEDDLDRLMSSASDTLDYIKLEAVPFIQTIMDDFIRNQQIQDEGRKIVACFGYHSPRSVETSSKKSATLPMPIPVPSSKFEVEEPHEPELQERLRKRRVTFSEIPTITAFDASQDAPAVIRRHSFCVGDIHLAKRALKSAEAKEMGKATDDSAATYECPMESAPYDESDLESSNWKVPIIKINDVRTDEDKESAEEDDHGYEKIINVDEGVDAAAPPKPQRGNPEEEEDDDTNAYEKVEVDERSGRVDVNENDYTELEELMAVLQEIAGTANEAEKIKDYDTVFDGTESMDKDGYEVPMSEEEILKSRSGSTEHLVDNVDEDDFFLPFAILFGEAGDDDGYEKIEIGAQEACPGSVNAETTPEVSEKPAAEMPPTVNNNEDDHEEENQPSRFSQYSEFDIVEALVKSGLMNAQEGDSVSDPKEENSTIMDCNESTTEKTLDNHDHCETTATIDLSMSTDKCTQRGKLERAASDDPSKEGSEMETSESDISNADENVIENVNEGESEKADSEQKEVTSEEVIHTRSFKKSINSNHHHSMTANILRRKKANHEKRQGSVFDEDIRIENVNFRSDSMDSDEGLGYHDSCEFKETTCSIVNNSFGFPAPAAEDGQSVDLEYASDSSAGPNNISDDPVYDNVCTDDDDVSASFTEGSEDAVQENKQDTQSMGSLDELCNVGEIRGVRSVMSKSIHCIPSGDRQLMKEQEGPEGKPPKPRRTWYYRSSADVRRSIIRSFGLDTDAIMHNPTYAQVTKPSTRVIHGSLPGRSNHGGGHRTMKRIPLTLSRHSRAIYKERFPSRSSKLGRNTSHDSGVLTGDEDSRSTIRDTEIYSQSHLYEEVASVTRTGERTAVKPEARKTLTMDEDTTEPPRMPKFETTYEVCTQWVNDDTADAISTFDRLTKKLVSPYSIIPMVRQVEGHRRKSQGNAIEEEEAIDFPAWTSILNVLAADEDKWNLPLAAQVLPVIDRLFYTKDEAIMDAAIELVHVLVKKFGRDIEKNHHGGLFRTKLRDDSRTCYHWLGKLHTRVNDLVRKDSEAEEIDLDSMLHASLLSSLIEALKPFTTKSQSIKDTMKY